MLLKKHKYVLTSSDLQYGFKAKHSTTHYTFVLQDILDYMTSNNSSLFLVLLDASRAFDRVQYMKLFRLFRRRDLYPLTCRFLAYMYTNQSLRVNWNGCYSNPFSTSNGVKQGGILSPILFCIYMKEFLSRLKQSGVGCYIGDMYLDGLGYADDLCLRAPTRGASQKNA
jgi:retron-type reverse transcriptase